VRTDEEVDRALEFWKPKLAESKAHPGSPVNVMCQVIVWTLEWTKGRDVGDIVVEAEPIAWIQSMTYGTPVDDVRDSGTPAP